MFKYEETGKTVAPLAGFEPTTRGLGNRCSILLSYRDTVRILPGVGDSVNVAPRAVLYPARWKFAGQ